MSAESCLSIVVEEENVVETVNEVGLILSGIIGFLVGALLGFVIFKIFAEKRCCFAAPRAVGARETKEEAGSSVNTSVIYENSFTAAPEKSSSPGTGSRRKRHDLEEEEDFLGRGRFFRLDDFVTDITWDKMLLELGKQELVELLRLEICMWEERHICLLQMYRCDLNDLLAQKFISAPQYHDILVQEEKLLCIPLTKMKDQWNSYIREVAGFKGQSLIDSFVPFQGAYAERVRDVVSAYRESLHRFAASISQTVDSETASLIRESLATQMDTVEGFFRENQDEMMESSHSVFREFGTVVRELVITLICESELGRLLTATFNTSLEKLVKTGRISSTTKQKMKDILQDDFDITKDEVREVFSQMHPNILTHYDSSLRTHEKESEALVQSILSGYEGQRSFQGFAEAYLSARCEQKLRRLSLLKEFAESELNGIASKLAKLSDIQETKRLEAMRTFCVLLQENDALSAAELQQLKQGFVKKLDATRAKVFSTCKRNVTEIWRLYEEHCGRQYEEENRLDASILQDSVTDDLVSLEAFLLLQSSLSDDDQHSIMQERESLFLLLVNQINTFRVKWLRVVENDLAKCQAFLLTKKSSDLVSDTAAEIVGIIQRLWNERNSMRNCVKETGSLACVKSVMGISRPEMVKVLSRKMARNLTAEQLPKQRETSLLEGIQKNLVERISEKNSFSNFASVTQNHNDGVSSVVKGELDRHAVALSMLEEDIRAEHDKRQGRLDVKARRIAQHTPPSGATPGDIQPFLEQLILQNQVSRDTDAVESDSVQQSLIECLRLDRVTHEAISQALNDSEMLLLAKFAVLAGLTKSEYTSYVSRAKTSASSQSSGRKVPQKFLKFWKDALAHVKRISY